MRSLLVVIAGALAWSGCADERLGRAPTPAERDAAAAMADQVAALESVVHQPGNTEALITATSAAPILSFIAPAGIPAVLPTRPVGARLRGCLTDSATTATFTECELGEHMIDGSAARVDGRTHAGLSNVLIVGPSLHGATSVDARLSGGSTTTGRVDVDAMWTVGDDEYVLDAQLSVHSLRLDEAGCAVAGSLTISATLRHADDLVRAETRSLSFGPACGDLHVSP